MKTNDKRYVIFLDIDGTLMGRSEEALARNLEVIGKVRSLGHKVLVNTGRSTAYLPGNIDFERHFDGVVSGGGARIVLDGKEIFCKMIEQNDIRKFCEVGFKQETMGILEGVRDIFYVGEDIEGHPDWIQINEENLDEVIRKSPEIEKFTVLRVASAEYGRVLGEKYVVLQHKGYAEIIKKAHTKSGAVRIVMNYLGLPEEQSIAMGDSLNDYDMLECAGIGVAMGNAIPEIKNIADMITEDVNDAGVAAALEKIFELR